MRLLVTEVSSRLRMGLLEGQRSVGYPVDGAGPDDCPIRPFAFDELLARNKPLLRHRHGEQAPNLSGAVIKLTRADGATTVAGRRPAPPPRLYCASPDLIPRLTPFGRDFIIDTRRSLTCVPGKSA